MGLADKPMPGAPGKPGMQNKLSVLNTPGKSIIPVMPMETYWAARDIYNQEHIYLLIGDQLDEILFQIDWNRLNPDMRLDHTSISRLSLVTAFQFAEYIPDEVASNATRKRIDWKYALHLPVQSQGIQAGALCAFRQGAYSSSSALHEFGRLIECLGKIGLFPIVSLHTLTASHLLIAVCQANRLHLLDQAMRSALSLLTALDQDWLRKNALPHWYMRFKTGRLSPVLNHTQEAAAEEAERLGVDIHYLLTAIRDQNRTDLSEREEIENLTFLWQTQFVRSGDQYIWRLPGCANCSSNYFSPENDPA